MHVRKEVLISGLPSLDDKDVVIISDSEEETEEVIYAEEIIADNSNNKIDKCFQIGPCYLLNQLYAKQSEVENFKLLEMMLGPEEEEGEEVDVEDPDWSYLDENVGVEVGGRDSINYYIQGNYFKSSPVLTTDTFLHFRASCPRPSYFKSSY